MNDGASFVAEALHAADRARERGGARIVDLGLAGAWIRLHLHGPAVVDALLPALRPRAIGARPAEGTPGAEPPIEIDACDGAGSALDLPAWREWLIDPRGRSDGPAGEGAGDDPGDGPATIAPTNARTSSPTNAPRCAAAFNAGSGVLLAFDRARRRGFWWSRDARRVPQWECASPMRALLAWALEDRGAAVVHAAAVAVDGAALLLAAPGGSGKSTTALRCLDAGFEFLGDNNVAVTLDPEPRVHSLFASASLRRDRRVEVPGFLPAVGTRPGSDAKDFALPGAEQADRFPASRPLTAIVMPRVGGSTRSRLLPAAPGLALRALAPSTLFAQPASGGRDLARMSALVRRLPCFTLDLADDGPMIPRLLRDRLEACRAPAAETVPAGASR